jgi:quercetin dioxygenase-like cupin family protein
MNAFTGGGLALLRDSGAPWEDADPQTFTGRARIKRLGGAGGRPEIRLYRVAFEPGARTHWHAHSGPQLLLVIDGRCLVQRWDGPLEVATAGDVVHISPGEKHWHGAGRAEGATHGAVNVDAATTWMEPVDDARLS